MEQNQRRFGILLHPTSLPGRFGIGDLGPQAHGWLDALKEMGVRLWQILPLGPTGSGESPYAPHSTFAGNPMLISLEVLQEEGLLSHEEPPPELSQNPLWINYEAVQPYKQVRLRQAFEAFKARRLDESPEFMNFSATNAWWLEDFSTYMALKERHGGAPWYEWEEPVARHHEQELDRLRGELADELTFIRFIQYQFDRQWRALREHAQANDILIMGDIPIFVAHDSSDVWAHPNLFRLQDDGQPLVVAGVPPDCFTETGQLWGNPVYDWEEMRREDYRWWLDRIRHLLGQVDLIRLDHFRGFEAYWAVPAGHETAVHGSWVPAAGSHFFERLREEFGELPLIAENLGFITPEVERMRTHFNLSGMAILQFSFGENVGCGVFRPHDWDHDTVAYTGTHDNDTVVGWWRTVNPDDPEAPPDQVREREFARDYLNINGEGVHWAFLRCLVASVSQLVIAPLQDIMGLGGEARMNVPGSDQGNWRWRFTWEMLDDQTRRQLRRLLEVYDRLQVARPSVVTMTE